MDEEKLKVGDYVRVKRHVEQPLYGWKDIKPEEVGVIREIKGAGIKIDFPNQENWEGVAIEIEKVKNPFYIFIHVLRDEDPQEIISSLKRALQSLNKKEKEFIFLEVRYDYLVDEEAAKISPPPTHSIDIPEVDIISEPLFNIAIDKFKGPFISPPFDLKNFLTMCSDEFQQLYKEIGEKVDRYTYNEIKRFLMNVEDPFKKISEIYRIINNEIIITTFNFFTPFIKEGKIKEIEEFLSNLKQRKGEDAIPYLKWLSSNGIDIKKYDDSYFEVYSKFKNIRELLNEEEIKSLAKLLRTFEEKKISEKEEIKYIAMIEEYKKWK